MNDTPGRPTAMIPSSPATTTAALCAAVLILHLLLALGGWLIQKL